MESSCLGWLVRIGGTSDAGTARAGMPQLPFKRAWSDPTASGLHCSNSGPSVLEKYRVSRGPLGRGRYATVRAAAARKTGKQFALKTVHKTGTHRKEPAILWNEILIQRACNHPHLVRSYESFESPAHLHIVMEICTGGDVLELLRQGSLNEADASLVTKQVLRAVVYLHDVKHVAHRDIKPMNLLLKFKGVPLAENCIKLADFGLAGSFTPGERTFDVVCGTPFYMAPEILMGPYDERCDLWSCGVTLYECLSGRLPFQGTSMREILTVALSSPPGLHDINWLGVSPFANALIWQMCDKHVTTRTSADQALQSSWFLS